jgi:TM2 domain-containing membrane protein YozV
MILTALLIYFLIGGIVAYRTRESSVSKQDSLLLGIAWPLLALLYVLGWLLNLTGFKIH